MPRSCPVFSSLRWAGVVVATSGVLALFLAPRLALAQVVSEADRQAARELFQQGFQLQQTAKYAEALDKFERAQAVFSAPTNLLHIAECQAQLGQLVESSETYRGLAHLALPKDAPQAFVAAQTQGAAELQQIEPRIPRVRIDVTPSNLPGLSVTIDEQPMSVALVGVDRPIDPGTHKVAAFAPGYVRQEKAVVIQEKDPPKPVGFSLQPGAGVTYAQALPPGTLYPGAGGPIAEPYTVVNEKPWTPTWTSTGFFFGARLGAAVPSGQAIPASAKAGLGVAIEGFLRFAHKGFVGVLGEHDFYAGGSTGTSASSNFAAAAIGFTTNAEGAGFMMDFFGGYRWFNFSGPTPAATGDIPPATYGSGEGGLGMGVWIAAGKSLRIVPRFEASFGSFAAQNGTSLVTAPETTKDNGYAVLFFGVSGDYNIDLKAKSH
jgi:hypothetical protein